MYIVGKYACLHVLRLAGVSRRDGSAGAVLTSERGGRFGDSRHGARETPRFARSRSMIGGADTSPSFPSVLASLWLRPIRPDPEGTEHFRSKIRRHRARSRPALPVATPRPRPSSSATAPGVREEAFRAPGIIYPISAPILQSAKSHFNCQLMNYRKNKRVLFIL